MNKKLRVQCSPLTGKINAGKVSKDATCFVGTTEDVTSDAIGAVIEKIRFESPKDNRMEISVGGVVKYSLVLVEIHEKNEIKNG